MGKFNQKQTSATELTIEDDGIESGVDWQKLMADFQVLSVEDAMKNIMSKVATSERVEFDQICLILKHYLLLEDNKAYLNHFISYESNSYVDLVLDRFVSSSDSPNVQWMITEILKVLSSVCDIEQVLCLLKSHKLQNLLCNSLFDQGILEKLKRHNGMTNTEVATLANLFETVSNLCEIYASLVGFVTASHVDWMSEAILNASKIHKEFIVSIVRLIHLISEKLGKCDLNNNLSNTQPLTESLLSLFGSKNFLSTAVEHLSNESSQTVNNSGTVDFLANNLTAKLYLIATYANLIVSAEPATCELAKGQELLKLVKDYGKFIQSALNIELRESAGSRIKEQPEQIGEEAPEVGEEVRLMIKETENQIECKLIAVDTVKLISSFFIKEDQEVENDYEEVESDEETSADQNDMDTDMLNTDLSSSEISDMNNLLCLMCDLNLMQLLVKTIVLDDENIYQDTDRIGHIFNSVNLLRLESLDVYLLLVHKTGDVKAQNLLDLLKYIALKPKENLGHDLIDRLVNAIHEIYVYLNTKSSIELEAKLEVIELIKSILLKFQTEDCELCVKLGRVLALMAIRERNENLIGGYPIIEASCSILIELCTASFSGLMDQNKVETLVVNAELLDLVIDIFGEDCLGQLETLLRFKERIQGYSEQFYNKYKLLAKNRKLKKDNCLIVKTVRDNLKSFVQYKMSK